MTRPLFIKTPWERAGDYDESSQSFTMCRIPAPPEARAVVEDLPYARMRRMTYEFRNACPKCLEAIVFRWDYNITDTVRESARGEWPAMKALDLMQEQAASLSMERDAAWAAERSARDTAAFNAAGWLEEQERTEKLRAALSSRRRKAKATEAQRRKAGDRRRRNAQ